MVLLKKGSFPKKSEKKKTGNLSGSIMFYYYFLLFSVLEAEPLTLFMFIFLRENWVGRIYKHP